MSASLEGLRALSTYRRLLQIYDPEGLDGTLRVVRDGAGDASALSLSTSAAAVTGTLTVNGADVMDFSARFVAWMASLPTTPEAAGVGNPYNMGGIPAIAQS
jgi:hypothetical protein